jgi:hypothetical protein
LRANPTESSKKITKKRIKNKTKSI